MLTVSDPQRLLSLQRVHQPYLKLGISRKWFKSLLPITIYAHLHGKPEIDIQKKWLSWLYIPYYIFGLVHTCRSFFSKTGSLKKQIKLECPLFYSLESSLEQICLHRYQKKSNRLCLFLKGQQARLEKVVLSSKSGCMIGFFSTHVVLWTWRKLQSPSSAAKSRPAGMCELSIIS